MNIKKIALWSLGIIFTLIVIGALSDNKTPSNEKAVLSTVTNIEDTSKNIDTEQLAKLETERLAKIEADKLAKKEVDRLAQVEADRVAKEEADKVAKAESDRLAKATQSYNTSQEKSYTVYITNTGAKYHKSGCRYLSKSCIKADLNDAIAEGYTACKVCKP